MGAGDPWPQLPRHPWKLLAGRISIDSPLDFVNSHPQAVSHLCDSTLARLTTQPLSPGLVQKTTKPPSAPPSSVVPRSNLPTMAPMPAEERIALIKENLAETLDFEIIEKIINDGKDPKVYWGT